LRRHVCDWSEYDDDTRQLIALVDGDKDAAIALLLMAFPSTPAQQLKCGRNSSKALNAVERRFSSYRIDLGTPVTKIGYISNDFRDHPVGRLVVELFARHDRSKCEVFAYSMGKDDDSPVRRRIRESSDHFIDIHPLSNVEAAKRIHQDAIEILVDLSGPALGSRMEVMAGRPAPVQVSFIGCPGSMGADWIDYIIADPYLVPFDRQPWFSEKIVHLPDCYQPSDPTRIRVPLQVTRADCGLGEDAFVYCSFNNTLKITPEMFDTWMRILRRVEGSVLWLYCKSPETIKNLLQRAELRGVSANRIVFASFAAMDVYLSRFSLADLFLDSFPYNAGATCNDALWAGLPVLTCAGDTYVSRMAGSLLTTLELPELITHSLGDYEAQAIKLATRQVELKSIRQRLIEQRERSPLFDMDGFVRNLEKAYLQMQRSWRRGEKPAPFAVQR
jgi:predicted O-linked N-acetylglucosamine transferase (SPINDLY family)